MEKNFLVLAFGLFFALSGYAQDKCESLFDRYSQALIESGSTYIDGELVDPGTFRYSFTYVDMVAYVQVAVRESEIQAAKGMQGDSTFWRRDLQSSIETAENPRYAGTGAAKSANQEVLRLQTLICIEENLNGVGG